MKKNSLIILVILAMATACGGKSGSEETALTPEQENQLLDSISKDMDQQQQELNSRADSVTAEVDSLLKDI
jgi:hypothetical protein